MHGTADPFAEGAADIGFLCSPSYLYLRERTPSVDLVPAGFVFRNARHSGEPVYFSEVVVRKEHRARVFADLAGAVWGYNDECSLSGYFSTLQELSSLGRDDRFFRRWVRTGSHVASVRSVLDGAIDGAAIDSVALDLMLRERPAWRSRLRVLESFGPFPIQPVVIRSSLAAEWRAPIAEALLDLPGDAGALARFGLEDCVPISDEAYGAEYRALCALGCLGRAGDERSRATATERCASR